MLSIVCGGDAKVQFTQSTLRGLPCEPGIIFKMAAKASSAVTWV